jgi:hypothetical protein
VAMESTKINLCDYCLQNMPECINEKIEFGDGRGNDNVIECDGFTTCMKGGSNIKHIGYNAVKSSVMIEFNNESIYEYSNVPVAVYQAHLIAPSMGSFIHQNYKGVYSYKRLK